jgi:hypothetical protein
MNFNFDDAAVRRSQDGMQRAIRGGLTVILLLLAGLAALEIVMFAQDYLHALKG